MTLIKEHIDIGYDDNELDEMSEYIDQFEQAYSIIDKEMKS